MAVNAIVGPQCPQNMKEVTSVASWVRRRETRYDASAKRAYLMVVGTRLLCVDKKVELVLPPINVPKDLQKPGFHAASVQPSNNVQNSHSAVVME